MGRKRLYESKAEMVSAKNRSWYFNNREYQLFRSARYRASKLGVPFTIEVADVIIPDMCPILKTPFVHGTMFSASLDRFDPATGYTPENVLVISRLANTMKNSANIEQLGRFSEWVNEVLLNGWKKTSIEL